MQSVFKNILNQADFEMDRIRQTFLGTDCKETHKCEITVNQSAGWLTVKSSNNHMGVQKDHKELATDQLTYHVRNPFSDHSCKAADASFHFFPLPTLMT